MSAISQKSISGITSITTPAGVDNVFTVHTNDTTERFRVDSTGNLNIAGISTFSEGIFIPDDKKLSIGNASGSNGDLQLFHTNNNSYVRDFGTGSLLIQGSGIYIQNSNGGTNIASFLENTGVSIPLDLDVDGHTNLDNVSIAGVTTITGALDVINSANTTIRIYDSTGTPDSFGSIGYNNGSDADDALVIAVDGDNQQSNSHIRFYVDGLTSSAEKFRINSDGQIKIANGGFLSVNTNPAATYGVAEALRIDDGAGTNDRGLQIFEYTHSGARYHRIQFNTNTTTNGSAYTYTQGNYGGSSSIEFDNSGHLSFFTNAQVTGGSTDSITPTKRLRIDSNGLVEITNSLDILGNTDDVVQATMTRASDPNFQIQFRNESSSNNVNESQGKFGLFYASNSADICGMQFRRGSSTGAGSLSFTTGGTERLRIDSGGRILIGTTTEGHAAGDNLTVADSGNAGITIRSGSSNNGSLYFSDGTSGAAEYRGAVRYNHTDNYLQFYTNGSEKLRIDSSGRVMMGGATSAHGSANADDLVIGAVDQANQTGITIGSASASSIRFADAGNDTAGGIYYAHGNDDMIFYAGGNARGKIYDNAGITGIEHHRFIPFLIGYDVQNTTNITMSKGFAGMSSLPMNADGDKAYMSYVTHWRHREYAGVYFWYGASGNTSGATFDWDFTVYNASSGGGYSSSSHTFTVTSGTMSNGKMYRLNATSSWPTHAATKFVQFVIEYDELQNGTSLQLSGMELVEYTTP